MNRRFFISSLLVLSLYSADADLVAYGAKREVIATKGTLKFPGEENIRFARADC